MKSKVKDFLFFIISIVLLYGILFSLGFTCPIKAVTGISCPGCGMTRAWISLIKPNPRMAFYYHPLFPIPAIVFLGYIFRKKLPHKLKKIGIIIIICLFFAVYIWRMINPNDTIVVFKPTESIVYKAYQSFKKN